ncbi:MAG: hypothetical protein ABSF75_10335 [Terracidiphilus sp.]|jgi:hypothetical protein
MKMIEAGIKSHLRVIVLFPERTPSEQKQRYPARIPRRCFLPWDADSLFQLFADGGKWAMGACSRNATLAFETLAAHPAMCTPLGPPNMLQPVPAEGWSISWNHVFAAG